MKKKLLLTSILSVIMCVSLIVGATFALFTSQDEVNVAITSGKVNVTAEFVEGSVATKQLYDTDYTADKYSMYQGTVEFTNDNKSLSLSNLVPGDAVKFQILVTNNSTVEAQYRTIVSCDNNGGLFEGLAVSISGVSANYNGKRFSTNWSTMPAGKQYIDVEISLPDAEDNNKYQDKGCSITYFIEAVQDNADMDEEIIASENVEVSNGSTTNEVEISAVGAGAFLPQGTTLKNGETSVTLTVKESNEEVNTGLTAIVGSTNTKVFEISIPEVAEDNTGLIIITLEEVATANLSSDEVKMFHSGSAMTIKDSVQSLTEADTFYYNPANGNITIAVTNFSLFSIVEGGAIEDAYGISNVEGLKLFRDLVNAGEYDKSKPAKLYANIDLNGENWTPIGHAKNNFKGTFDGQGYTISNLYIYDETNADSIAFFGYASNANIKNITFENVNVNAYKCSAAIVGDLTTGTITNCHVKGDISIVARNNYAGGIVSWGYCDIINCSIIADEVGYITAKSVAGGICARNNEGAHTIKDCALKNMDIASSQQTAAIAGFAHYGNSILDCNVENVNLNLVTEGTDMPAIGLATGLWYYKETSLVTISNNIFKNVTVNAFITTPIDADILTGWEWNSHLTGFVAENNTYENVADNRCFKATNNEELDTAIKNGVTSITLMEGVYVIPNSAAGKTLRFVGNGDVKIATNNDTGSYEGCNYALNGSTVEFVNVSINTPSTTYIGYAGANVTFTDCVFNGLFTLYGNSVFNNCEFNVSGDVYNISTWAAPTATFNGCTFNSDGKALLLYGGANTILTLNDCVFNDNGGLTDKKAAVEIGNDYGVSYELIVNNTIVNGYEINDKGINTGSTLWGNKNSMGKDKLNVIVDGVDVY